MITFVYKNKKQCHFKSPNAWSAVAPIGHETQEVYLKDIKLKNKTQVDYLIKLLENVKSGM